MIEAVTVIAVSISSLCHQEFWVRHMVELLPSGLATGQKTPAHARTHAHTHTHTRTHTQTGR